MKTPRNFVFVAASRQSTTETAEAVGATKAWLTDNVDLQGDVTFLAHPDGHAAEVAAQLSSHWQPNGLLSPRNRGYLDSVTPVQSKFYFPETRYIETRTSRHVAPAGRWG